jgi:hypothetical protein
MFSKALCVLLFASSNGGVVVLCCLAGMAGGAVLFFKGFSMLRFKRLILDTPLSRIHSASIGLVEVTGTPVGPYILSAPITGDPCYYYRVRAWQWVESGKEHEWKSVLDESLHVPFFLEDSTGRALIDPQGADLDVHKSFSDEVGASFFRTPGMMPPNVLKFLATRGLVPEEKIKLEERIIPQGLPLFVFGTLGENLALNSGSVRPRMNSATTVSFDSPSRGSSAGVTFRTPIGASVSSRGATAVADVLSHLPGVQVETTEIQIPKDGAPAVVPDRAAASWNRAGMTLPPNVLPNSAKPSSDKSAFGEFDLHPSVAIGKGEHKEPFAISGYSQKELVSKLAWKSMACIWGGPVVTLACAYFLMVYLQWIP